jgi:hypothetical protein
MLIRKVLIMIMALSLLLLINITICSSVSSLKPETDLEQDGLIGPVSKVTISKAKLTEQFGKIVEGQAKLQSIFYYNSKGNLIEKTFFDENQPFDGMWTYTYDSEGKPTEAVCWGGFGKEVYDYDSKGLLVKKTLYGITGKIDNIYLESRVNDADTRGRFEIASKSFLYDENSRLKEADGLRYSYDTQGRVISLSDAKNSGQTVIQEVLDPDTGKYKTVESKTEPNEYAKFAYDKNGKLSKVVFEDYWVREYSYTEDYIDNIAYEETPHENVKGNKVTIKLYPLGSPNRPEGEAVLFYSKNGLLLYESRNNLVIPPPGDTGKGVNYKKAPEIYTINSAKQISEEFVQHQGDIQPINIREDYTPFGYKNYLKVGLEWKYKYDSNNRVAEESGKTCRWVYRYDSKGKLAERDCYAKDNPKNPIRKQVFTYDSNGNVVRSSFFILQGKKSFKYNQDGNLAEEIFSSADGEFDRKWVWVYGKDGKPIERNMYSDQEGKSLIAKVVYKYNTQGKVTEKALYSGDGSLTQKRTYEDKGGLVKQILQTGNHQAIYDAKGNILEEFDDNGNAQINKKVYTYDKLDSKGNWIKQTVSKVVSKSGKTSMVPVDVVNRIITY